MGPLNSGVIVQPFDPAILVPEIRSLCFFITIGNEKQVPSIACLLYIYLGS